MTKVITENFRVENTNELFTSFKNLNSTLSSNFATSLNSLITTGTAAGSMSTDQKNTIKGFVDSQLTALRPEANYYVMASTVDTVSAISNTQKEKREFQRRVIFGNKVNDDSVRYMFPESKWESKVYDNYDDSKDVATNNCIATVKDAEGNYYVYKCLDNNKSVENPNGAISTQQPLFSNIDSTTYESITRSDGYIWKYLFKVSTSDAQLYRTLNDLPLPYPSYGDSAVIAAAKEDISFIDINDTPTGQFNQLLFGQATNTNNCSNVTFVSEAEVSSSRLKEVVVLKESTTLSLATANDSYKNIYLKSSSGKLYDVLNSVTSVDGSKLTLTIDTDDTILGVGDTARNCQLVLKIKVSQPDLSGTHCIAYGILNTSGTLSKVAFVQRGSNYKVATAEVIYPQLISSPGTTTLTPIVSPKGGHGFDLITELGMSKLSILTDFNGESTTVPDSNYYTKVGLVKNPTFSAGTFPASFDNRIVFTKTGADITSTMTAGSFITQLIKTVDIRDIVAGGLYVINEIGSGNQAMTSSDWETLGWTSAASGDGSSTPTLGSRFTAKSDGSVATWQASNTNKRGVASEAVSALTGAPGEETITAKIHEAVLSNSNTVISLVDYKGAFESKFHLGPIFVKTTLASEESTEFSINTNDTVVYGSYNEFSGDILHFMDFDPVERTATRKEKIKFTFDF